MIHHDRSHVLYYSSTKPAGIRDPTPHAVEGAVIFLLFMTIIFVLLVTRMPSL